MNYNDIETTAAEPCASSMILTFRAIGYNLETAVADVIDNSISANAKNIWFSSEWNGGNSVITILDDGCGMNNEELVQAMKPGAKNPMDKRPEKDLGRFGLGLKTASFSQCQKLIVVSKKAGFAPIYWIWDLNYVNKTNKWELIRYPIADDFLHALDKLESGTLVIWTDLDRIIPPDTLQSNEIVKDKFLAQMAKVKQHLAMTFHRFIEEKSVKLFCWGHEVKPWNPFVTTKSQTQLFSDDYLDSHTFVKGYVLPHKSYFTKEEHLDAGGIKGWVAQQGFYVYRSKRLLLAGDWLGLFRKEVHYQLARIQIDLPNQSDNEWLIDIKKSTARLPFEIQERIKSYASTVRKKAEEVFRHRGKLYKIRNGQEFHLLWQPKKQGTKILFEVNRNHLLVKELVEMAKTKPERAIESLFRLIEETIPTKSIFIKESEGEIAEPFENNNEDLVKTWIKQIYNAQKASGKSVDQIKLLLANMEPFNNFPHLIELIEEI
ncbi:MAG: ATP-binding protein [Prevotellaceae bacterium]|jgi:hypothetical protein|nr:ATP-binding protein [Prevotellaceae bacterium]